MRRILLSRLVPAICDGATESRVMVTLLGRSVDKDGNPKPDTFANGGKVLQLVIPDIDDSVEIQIPLREILLLIGKMPP